MARLCNFDDPGSFNLKMAGRDPILYKGTRYLPSQKIIIPKNVLKYGICQPRDQCCASGSDLIRNSLVWSDPGRIRPFEFFFLGLNFHVVSGEGLGKEIIPDVP